MVLRHDTAMDPALRDEDASRDSITLFFLTLMLAHLARRTQSKSEDMCNRAFQMLGDLACHLANTRGQVPEWDIASTLLGGCFLPPEDQYFPTSHITSDKCARSILKQLDISLPDEPRGDFNYWSLSLEPCHMFGFLIHAGQVPFLVVCALAGLMEDGVDLNSCVIPYEERPRPTNAIRFCANKADKAIAFKRVLDHPQWGVKRNMARAECLPRNPGSSTKNQSENPSSAEETLDALEFSQVCTTDPSSNAKVAQYRYVLKEASMLF